MRINWRYLAIAAVPTVLVAALLTFLAWPKGSGQASGSQASTSRTVVVGTTTLTTPDATTTTPATGQASKVRPVRLSGYFEGYCKDGKPVVTYTPEVTRTETQEIRPDCKGNIFGTLHVDLKSTGHYIGPKPGEPLISDVR